MKAPLWSVAVAVSVMVGGPALAAPPSETYLLTFQAQWSADTHPEDFPPSAQFSPLIGGTHNDNVTFWADGVIATIGLERLAENGIKTFFRNEVEAAITSGNACEVIEGFSLTDTPGSTTIGFTVSEEFSYVTIVGMISPSPDWFIGVNAIDLRSGGEWVEEIVIDLYPIDAGTDSGPTYLSADMNTLPHEPIIEISSYPFADAGQVAPVGTFTFTRLDINPCPADVDGDGSVGFTDAIAVLASWGVCPGCPEDFDDSGDVGLTDLLLVLSGWGPC